MSSPPASCTLRGIGTALPAGWIDQGETGVLAGRTGPPPGPEGEPGRRRISMLYRKVGVKRRHLVLVEPDSEGTEPERVPFYEPGPTGPSTGDRIAIYEQHAAPLAVRAAAAALRDAGVDPGRITQSVTVSCTGFAAPGVDCALIEDLGLPRSVGRTHVGFMGCHAALNGLRVAAALCAEDPSAVVLLTAVELCSLHHQYTPDPLSDAGQVIANALFADGAAAVVLTGADFVPDDPNEPPPVAEDVYQFLGSGSVLLADTGDAMTWRVGDAGFRMTLEPAVPEAIREHLSAWMDEWLGRFGLTQRDVGTWAVHPGGPAILDAAVDALNLPAEALNPSRSLLADVGNLSSPTILFLLDRLRATRDVSSGPVVAIGFGPGLTVEASLLG
ncbi:type III polyketide synthase [Alienimonas chondri]|uniref:Alpha-pyrone synthesis polyketide synthase-like Pks18 n=1 Tax=Alienimonas chondri TaxID=2681879 RepID=A0ABX1VFF9_9PLAN|nr:type III polyketide synthase [Alienimonas chondri]NNJ26003.1 Alpha-pyrone synthesis polyketide synthase-like Pks18 [Alienimonas chondri]